ncbi:MAG: selenocysteine-specific translation elongation factor [Actinomycetota bacterium]
MAGELRVVATAGHVDHGKSSLIVRLTGIDPDRWAEEKRRGLTIDLGYAWCTLPSGREIGFVDVPGHERFIGNMLAGVGPVPLVLFVVAADEGWKPQSEEHLQILDVLGVRGGVVALTKRDLVDDERLALAVEDVRERLAGSALANAPVIPVSSTTGDGVEELVAAIDTMLDGAEPPADARARLFVDRVFTIKGAGTVVTGTLAGGCLEVGDEIELDPSGLRARIRSLQTHKRTERAACPVSRVAVNVAGVDRERIARGDVLTRPDGWRATRVFEARLRPIRNLEHAITPRGAFKLYTGAAETDARLRLYGTTKLEPGSEAFVRITASAPLVLDVGDRFVLREAGRRETVGGGVVLDVAPPARSGPDPGSRLRARASAARETLPELLVGERGAIRRTEAAMLTGSGAAAGSTVGEWFVADRVLAAVRSSVGAFLETFHRDHALEPGADLAQARRVAIQALRSLRAPTDPALADALLGSLTAEGVTAREGSTIRMATHRTSLDERADDVDRLLAAIGGEREATPPTVKELLDDGFGRDVIDAAARAGLVVRIAPELIVTPQLVARAEGKIRDAADAGITVSALREALGTSRKYAVPLMEWLDQRGVTRREGDLRFARGSS